MRGFSIALLSALILTASGCMSAENGLCSPDESEAIFDPDLVGEWFIVNVKANSKEEKSFKVERDDPASKAYRISEIVDGKPGNGVDDSLKAYLVRLGDTLFLDFMVPEKGSKVKPARLEHCFFRVDLNKPGLNGNLKKPEATLLSLGVDVFEAHPELIPCVLPARIPFYQLKNFDLRLAFEAKNARELPNAGRSLIVLAVGGPMSHCRIFNAEGKIVMDLNLTRLKAQAREVDAFKKQVESLRPPHQITEAEKARVIAAIQSINSEAGVPRITATSEELREFLRNHVHDDAVWKKTVEHVHYKHR